jgi:CubicO group peptidase (beta-lactamase class C family)
MYGYRRSVLVLLAVCLLLFAVNACAKISTVEIETYLDACHEVNKFHGTVLIAHDGNILFKKGYGMANIEFDIPNSPEMIFQIGSITKQFTATCIMQLKEKGLLSVDDSISKYLPDYPKEVADIVTIHHLLTHTSGIVSYTSLGDLMMKRSVAMELNDLIDTFKDLPLEFTPGSKMSYCNSGYLLLGAIIENVSGISYENYLQENIFIPLGMKNSGYCHRDIILKNRASGYMENENGELINAGFVHMSVPFAGGALYSTVEDMLLWDQALYTEKILKKSSLEKMFTPFLDNYAYGWGVRDVNGRKLIRHGGGIDGFVTQFDRWVDDKYCVVVFSNNENASADDIATGLSKIIFNESYDVPIIKTPIAMDSKEYTEYAGVFEIKEDSYRVVTTDGEKIYSQRDGGRRFEVFPESKDKFFFEHDHNVTLKFVRDNNGKVTSHIIHQRGKDATAQKVEGEKANSIIEANRPSDIDPALLEKYAGVYDLTQFELNVYSRENKLFIQAMDQPELEITPKSKTDFINHEFSVNVIFSVDGDGSVTGVNMSTGGMEMSGKKIQ